MIALSNLFQTDKMQDPLTWYMKKDSLTWYEIKIKESFKCGIAPGNMCAKIDECQTPKQLDVCDPTSFTEYPQIVPSSRGDIFLYDKIRARLASGLPIVCWDIPVVTITAKPPKRCSQCLYHVGETHGGNYLHCSVHPKVIDDELSCPDFVRKTEKSTLEKENTFSYQGF